jgi:Outer membrane protein beta-barrel domain
MRRAVLVSFLILCMALPARAEEAGHWYLNAFAGGITPDKPWGASGRATLYGFDLGVNLADAWSAELDLSRANLSDRLGSQDSRLEGGALQVLRVFDRGAWFAPYVSLGAGLTHEAAGANSGVVSHTEFMVQPGIGAFLRIWERADGAASLALRPDIKARWTHGWAHAPGNPVDPMYVLGVTATF